MSRARLRIPDAQADLFAEDPPPTAAQRIAPWGTPEEIDRARRLMLNLGERWGDPSAAVDQAGLTEREWRQRRQAAAWRVFDGDDAKMAQPIISPHEERAFKRARP